MLKKVNFQSLQHVCYSCFHGISFTTLLPPAEANQEKIVEAGGLTSLLNLLRSSDDETVHRVAAGAIANLAMNGEAG